MKPFLLLTMISTSMSLPSDRVKGLLARIPNTCSTRTGDSCVFPFTYKGVEHYHCTYADSPTAWCATLTDSEGVVVTNRWGDCETSALSSCQEEQIIVPSCTTDSGPYSGNPCVFPFRYNGVTYTSCTTQDKSAAWCSTKTTLAGTHVPGYYGFCPSSCPGAEANTTSCSEADSGETFVSGRSTCACNNGVLDCSSTCTPGELFTVDCNTCIFNSQGEPTCTTNECSSGTSPPTTTTTTTTTAAPAGSCLTVGGPAQGSPCVFPFTFADTTYTSCTAWIYGGQPDGTTWCSTKVDASGNHVNNEGNYGFCGQDCNIPRDVSGEGFGEVFDTNARSAVIFGRQK